MKVFEMKNIDKLQKEIDKSIRIRDHIIPIVSNLIMVMVGLLGIICFTLGTLGKIKPESNIIYLFIPIQMLMMSMALIIKVILGRVYTKRIRLLFKVLRNLG